jgi:hypothetical protein
MLIILSAVKSMLKSVVAYELDFTNAQTGESCRLAFTS